MSLFHWNKKDKNGYILRYNPKSPEADNNGYVKRGRDNYTKVNGPIPFGMQIHHNDENKTNDKLSNLRLVTPKEHGEIHGIPPWKTKGAKNPQKPK
jgi:hypothetical protein